MSNYTFHWRPAFQALPAMLEGCLVTLQIALIGMLIGTTVAILLALMSSSKSHSLKALAWVWVEVARNTPALFQIYMIFFGLGQFGIHVGSYAALVAGIAFNNAGYLAETFRGGLRAIPHTQVRAARSIGFGPVSAFRLIVLPQLFRVVYAPLTNQMVWSILMTSLGIVVGMNVDLTGVTQELNVKTFRTFEYFLLAAVLYYLIAKAVTLGSSLLARRMFRY